MRHLRYCLVAIVLLTALLPLQVTQAQGRPTAIRGTVFWETSRDLTESVVITPGAALRIAAGVEVRLAPGVAMFVEAGGSLITTEATDQRVRLVNLPGQGRWEGIFGNPGSLVGLTNTDLVGGGAGGTLVAVESGSGLLISGVRILDSGGQIRALNTPVTVRGTEIAGGVMPYGAAIDVKFTAAGPISESRHVTVEFNRLAANRLATGAPIIRVANDDPQTPTTISIVGNYVEGWQGPGLTLVVEGEISGTLICNTLVGGSQGIRVESFRAPPNARPAINLRKNVIDRFPGQSAPPSIGRLGISSDLPLDASENWWGDPSGPFAPSRNPTGRGDHVGLNVQFQPWLTTRPDCVP